MNLISNTRTLPLLISLFYLHLANADIGVSNSSDADDSNFDDDVSKSVNSYKKLFKIKRKDHISAIERILLLDDVSKTAAFVDAMMKTIIKVSVKTIFC